jgi:hypothetical protein
VTSGQDTSTKSFPESGGDEGTDLTHTPGTARAEDKL